MGIFELFSSEKAKAAKRLAEEIELLHNSPLVDPVWYRQTYPDLRDTPLDVARHYLEHGAAEGRNPGPLFDTKFYLEQNPEVAASGMNPLVHYLLHGEAKGRWTSSRSELSKSNNQDLEISAAFGSDFQQSSGQDSSSKKMGNRDIVGGCVSQERTMPRLLANSEIPASIGIDASDSPIIARVEEFRQDLLRGWVCARSSAPQDVSLTLAMDGVTVVDLTTGCGRPDVDRVLNVNGLTKGFSLSLRDSDARDNVLRVLANRYHFSTADQNRDPNAKLDLTLIAHASRQSVSQNTDNTYIVPFPKSAKLRRTIAEWLEFFDAETQVLDFFWNVAEEWRGLVPPAAQTQTANVIAFYLPQFHPFAENDKWWGEGFTEWTSVATAEKQFPEHIAPNIPADLGFYDLRVRETRQRQGELAKQYGLYGFCYYFYWFAKTRLMQTPLDMILKERAPDLPFCLCWANETWSRRWDGSETEVLMRQNHDAEGDIGILSDLMPFFLDDRYIRIDGAPLLLIYRVSLMPEPARFIQLLRRAAQKNGLPGLFLCNVMSFGDTDLRSLGCDAAVEFPPHGVVASSMERATLKVPESFSGYIYDYEEVVTNRLIEGLKYDFPYFPGVMPRWDNTARRGFSSHIFHQAQPALFETWVAAAAEWTRSMHPSWPLVFVNSWNEWGEGAHLEPDRRFGRRFLEAIRRVVSQDRTAERARLAKLAEADPDTNSLVSALLLENRVIAKYLAKAGSLQGPEPLFSDFPDTVDRGRLVTGKGSAHIDQINGKASIRLCTKMSRHSTAYLRGWAIGDTASGNFQDAIGYFLFTRQTDKRTYYAVILEWIERTDVCGYFSLPESSKYCGFEMRVDISSIEPGTYEASVIVIDRYGASEAKANVQFAIY